MKNSAEGEESPGLVDLTRMSLRDLLALGPEDSALAHALRRAVGDDKKSKDAVSAFNSAI